MVAHGFWLDRQLVTKTVTMIASSFFGRSSSGAPSQALPIAPVFSSRTDSSTFLASKLDKIEEVLERQQSFLFSLQEVVQSTREKVEEAVQRVEDVESKLSAVSSQLESTCSSAEVPAKKVRLPKELSVRTNNL